MKTTARAIAHQLRQERLALANVGPVREHAASSARQRQQTEQARETLAKVVADFRRRRWIA